MKKTPKKRTRSSKETLEVVISSAISVNVFLIICAQKNKGAVWVH